MKIAGFSLKNVAGLPNMHCSFLESAQKPFDVVLVTGPTGSGKTRFLESIVAWKEVQGPYGLTPQMGTWAREGEPGFIEGTWEFSDEEKQKAESATSTIQVRAEVAAATRPPEVTKGISRILSTFARSGSISKLEYFPSSRRLSAASLPFPLRALSEKVEASIRLTKDAEKYGIEQAWLLDRLTRDLNASHTNLQAKGVLLAGQVTDSLGPVRTSLARLVPHLRLLGPSGDSVPTVRFARNKAASDPGGSHSPHLTTHVSLSDLSDGEHQALLFALTFHRIALSNSIVLIDLPELFIHPSDHARFFGELLRLGQNNQVIAATTSPGILAMVPPAQIIDLGALEQRP